MAHQNCNHNHNHNHSHNSHHRFSPDTPFKRIFLAFLINVAFAGIEVVGGIWTGSIAILADAVHDATDAFALLLAMFMEKNSHRPAGHTFTYGHKRLSLLSALIVGFVVLFSAVIIIVNAYERLNRPLQETPHGWGMMLLALLGIGVNGFAAWKMSEGKTQNERVITWHLLEDLLGWVIVFVGSIFILTLKWSWIDPALAIGISLFIAWNVLKQLITTTKIFLQISVTDFDVQKLKTEAVKISGIKNIHDIHTWSLDGESHVISCHVAVEENLSVEDVFRIKDQVRILVKTMGNFHATIEVEKHCDDCEDNCL